MPYEIIIPEKIQRIIDKKCNNHLKKRLYTKLLNFEIDENEKMIIIVGFKHKDEMA
jgi:mRNA-degrading endonuclease RelE of RelBE toxin-antitoxin system